MIGFSLGLTPGQGFGGAKPNLAAFEQWYLASGTWDNAGRWSDFADLAPAGQRKKWDDGLSIDVFGEFDDSKDLAP